MLTLAAVMLLSQSPVLPAVEGIASFYTVESSSTLTASGEYYEDEALTCAMLGGTFGEYYRVTSEDGRSVTVRLNDRGPYIDGRVIDLSRGAMRRLDPSLEKGILHVRIQRIEPPQYRHPINAYGNATVPAKS